MKVWGHCAITTEDIDPNTGKLCLKIVWPDKTSVHITTNLAEMIGGIGAGLRLRREDEEDAKR